MGETHSRIMDDSTPIVSTTADVMLLPCENSGVAEHSRGLDPPMSHSAVLQQFRKVTRFVRVIPNEPDLLVGTRKRKHSQTVDKDLSPESDTERTKKEDQDACNVIPAPLRSREATDLPQNRQESQQTPTVSKKRRLPIPETAFKTADESTQKLDLGQSPNESDIDQKDVHTSSPETSIDDAPDDVQTDEQAAPKLTTSTAFDDTTDDEGYGTNTPSPATSWTTTLTRSEQDGEHDDDMVKELLRVHKAACLKQSKQDLHSDEAVNAEWALLSGRKAQRLTKQQAERQAAAETRYAMRSKQLREGTLNEDAESEPAVDNGAERLNDEFTQPPIRSSFLQDTLASIRKPPSRQQCHSVQVPLRAEDLDDHLEKPLNFQVEFDHASHGEVTLRAATDSTANNTYRARTTPDPEKLLDYAKSYVNPRRAPREVGVGKLGPRQHRYSFNPTLNPASRAAADQWRTQNRHTEWEHDHRRHRLEPDQTYFEERLLAAQRGEKAVHTGRDAATSDQVSALEGNEAGSEPDRTTVQPATYTTPTDFAKDSNSESSSYRRSKIAEEIRARRIERREPALPLAQIADIDINDAEAIKIERVRLREQKRDLEVLKQAYTELAIIQKNRYLTEQDNERFDQLRRYAHLVLDEGRAAKASRAAISKLRDNFSRHAAKFLTLGSESSFEDVRKEVDQLLTPGRTQALEEALHRLPDLLNDLEELAGQQRQKAIEERKAEKFAARNKGKAELAEKQQVPKKVRFASSEPSVEGGSPRGISKKPRKKQSKEQLLRYKLALYESAALEREPEGQNGILSNNPTDVYDRDSSSEISEEDAGGDSYYGAVQKPSSGFMASTPFGRALDNDLEIREEQNIHEITALEEQRQKAEAAKRGVDGQGFDERLALQNKIAALERRAADEVVAEEFDDLASDASGSASNASEEDEVEEACQYSVRARFHGLGTFRDGDEYGYGRYFDRKKAEAKLGRIISTLKRELESEHGQDFDLKAKVRDNTTVEQTLAIGRVTAKTWIEKKIVDLSKRQTRKARKMMPVQVGYNWIVDWKKEIITTTTTTAVATIKTLPPTHKVRPIDETKVKGDNDDDDDDDLFGSFSPSPLPPPPPPPPPPAAAAAAAAIKPTLTIPSATSPSTSTTTTSESVQTILPSALDLDFYTTAHHANLRAKQVYLDWYATFCPVAERPSIRSPEYSGMLGQTEKALAEEVERASTVEGAVVGPWDAEFERPDREEEIEVPPETDGGGPGNVLKKVVKVTEKMVVRVVRNSVKGPRN